MDELGRDVIIDENSEKDVIASIKKSIEHLEKDRADSKRLSRELQPIIEDIYKKAGKPFPWRDGYTK